MTDIVPGPTLPSPALQLLSETGIVLLRFETGLDTGALCPVRTGLGPFTAITAGSILPLMLGYTLSHCLFSKGHTRSLIIGSTLTAPSPGITVRGPAGLDPGAGEETRVMPGAAMIDNIPGGCCPCCGTGGCAPAMPTQPLRAGCCGMPHCSWRLRRSWQERWGIIKRFRRAGQMPALIPAVVLSVVP